MAKTLTRKQVEDYKTITEGAGWLSLTALLAIIDACLSAMDEVREMGRAGYPSTRSDAIAVIREREAEIERLRAELKTAYELDAERAGDHG